MNCDNFKGFTNRLGKRIGCFDSNTNDPSKNIRPFIAPCNKPDAFERQDCYRHQGYFQLSSDQPNGIDFCLDRVQTNDNMIMGVDTYFPYNNEIILPKQLTSLLPFRGVKNQTWKSENGGYLKYDILTNTMVHLSLNTRQGNHPIANVGIMYGLSIDPSFQPASSLSNSRIQASIQSQSISTKNPFHEALDNNVLKIDDDARNIHLQVDVIECSSFGQLRILDENASDYNYYMYGLGPLSKGDKWNFTGNWLDQDNGGGIRCNKAFGNMQIFGIQASHWPVLFIQRFDKANGDSSCYAIFFDHYRKVEYNASFLQSFGKIYISTREPEVRCFVITGDNLAHVRSQYMNLIGSPSLMTRKTMGLWVGGFGFRNTKEMEAAIQDIKGGSGFPLEGLYLDLYWYGARFPEPIELAIPSYANNACYQDDVSMCVNSQDYLKGPQKTNIVKSDKVGIFEWDTTHFDPQKIDEFYDKHKVGVTLIYEPFYNLNGMDMSTLYEQKLLATTPKTRFVQPDAVWNNWLGNIIIPDFTQPQSGDYWYESRMKSRMSAGTFLWWNDLGEPEVYNQNAMYRGMGPVINEEMVALSCYRQHPSVHNYVQFLWAKGVSNAYQKDTNKRFNVLARAGAPGISRFGVFNWTGDTSAVVQDMIAHFRNMGTLSLSGQDFICSDAGGFSGDNGKQAQFIYSYWFANACGVEITVKPHKWFNDKVKSSSPTKWGNTSKNQSNILLRYQLLPFYYSTALSISEMGHRRYQHFSIPLYTQYPEERLYKDVNAGLNFLVGDNLLVPLYMPAMADRNTNNEADLKVPDRPVLLPSNTKWYDLAQKKWITGNQFILPGDDPLLRVFVKDKSILVLADINKDYKDNMDSINAENIYEAPITIHVFDSTKTFKDIKPLVLYVDDGVTLDPDQISRVVISVQENGMVNVDYVNQTSSSLTLDFSRVLLNQSESLPMNASFYHRPVRTSTPTPTMTPQSRKKSTLVALYITIVVIVLIVFVLFWFLA